jgi:hypothetical protein
MTKGHTFANDLKSAGKALDESARLIKYSVTLGGVWFEPKEKEEYDELRRLAKRMREIARAFQVRDEISKVKK